MPRSARSPSITRRDFLDGIAVSAAALLASADRGEARPAGTYPPSLTGLRGAHPGSFETLHRLRSPQFWSEVPAAERTRESYDLVVVGAGISGLAAAWQFRKERPGASILILDNHDDFGGHAKRNELTGAGVTRIGYGGSQSISSPAPYSRAAKALIAELGVPMSRYERYVDWSIYRDRGLSQAFFFDREAFGDDRLVPHFGRPELDPGFVMGAPLSDHAKRDLIRLTTERLDPYAGQSEAEKRNRLARLSYRDFLTGTWKIDPSILPLFQTRPHGLYGVGIDAVPAQDASGLGLPGLQGLGLSDKPGPGQNLDSIRSEGAADYFFHFPDGNATIARLLVRRLIPAALPSRSFERAITTRADYSALDRSGSRTRIRLSSSVVRVRHIGDVGAARRVEIIYQQAGRLKTVAARRVILACWHTVIPLICPELPPAQREALGYGVKVPVVYTSVLLRNWRAFLKLGVNRIAAPAFWHTNFALDFPVSIGAYRFPRSPDEPIVLRLTKAACQPGLAARDQHRAGRLQLLETPFETIERSIRAELDRMLSRGGFDAGHDILAITVNRWPHGYSYQYNSLYDPFWLDGGITPAEIARRPFGRISIANADAGAYAYADGAIDHGLRAAREALTALRG